MSDQTSWKEPLTLAAIAFIALCISGINPFDRLTWWLEVAPVLIAMPILFMTAKQFRLSPLLYRLILIHALILIVGGHYTYANVPIGHWFQEAFGLARNHYDRLGHLAQGFIPAILARELIIRHLGRLPKKWLTLFVVSICLAFSAFYEMLEWWTAVAGGGSAEAFLGTQGDVWDTQWDMFLAAIGACSALLLLSRTHDRSLSQVQ